MEKVAQFYSAHPYPQLPMKAKKDVFGKLHNTVMRRILEASNLAPADLKGARVLDAGCGTGEKSIYFDLHGAHATGIDISENSLSIAKQTAKKLGAHPAFLKLDIFDIPKHPEFSSSFDHVFSIGVIHHTRSAREACHILSGCVKPGGTLTLGLYHSYGRIYLRAESAWIRFMSGGNREKGLEYISRHLLHRPFKSDGERAYLADTYLHPHETHHTISEVKNWLVENKLQFVGVTPKPAPPLGELQWIFQKRGFFTVGARKMR